MIITWKIALRLVLLGLVTVILQVSFFSYLSILGATPNVLPVVACSVGLLGGAVAGACFGFSLGLLIDAALLQPMGAWALVLMGVGYLAGRYREAGEVTDRRVPAFAAAALTLFAGVAYAGLQLMLGVEGEVNLALVRDVIVTALLAGLLAFPLHPTVKLILRPALVAERSEPGRLARLAGRVARPGARRRRRRESRRERERLRRERISSSQIGDAA